MNTDFIKLAKDVNKIPKEEFYKELKRSNPADHKELVRLKSYFDLKFFCLFFFSVETEEGKIEGHTSDPFNQFHKDYFKDFNPNEESVRKVIMAARGAAKTTLVCLMDPLHRVCFGTEKYILILSSTTPLARGKAKDIHSEISHNEKLNEYFGLDFDVKRPSSEKFSVKSDFGYCHIHSIGFFGQLRGIKWGSQRPTRIILDDVTHSEHIHSEAQREKMERQLKTDIQNTAQPATNQIAIGTIIHQQDPIVKLLDNPTWKGSNYPAVIEWPKNQSLWDKWENIWVDPTYTKEEKANKALLFYKKNKKKMDEGHKVLWPEREPLYYLMKLRVDIGRRAFNAEKLMEAYLTGESLFTNIFWFSPETVDNRWGFRIHHNNKFIPFDTTVFQAFYSCDPATSDKKLRKSQTQKKTLSKSARIVGMRNLDTGIIYILHAKMDRAAPSLLINEMYDLHAQHDFVRMGFEENLFREMFGEALRRERKERQRQTGEDCILPMFSIWATQDKEHRIYSTEPDIVYGKIFFSTHLPESCKTQLIDYPNVDHVDFLDAVEIMKEVSNPKNKLQRMSWDEFR